MKTNWIKLTFVGVTLLTSTLSFAQKMNETDAAVAYKNQYLPAYAEGDFAAAKTALTKAKLKIDLAAEHPETKENQKTLYYKGAIYSAIFQLSVQTRDSIFGLSIGENGLDIAAEALKNGYLKTGKMKSDIEECALSNKMMLQVFAEAIFNANQFKEAAEVFATEAKFSEAINQLDTFAVYKAGISFEKINDFTNAIKYYMILAKVDYNGAYCYALASSAMRKNKQFEEAKTLVNDARKKYPLDKDLILESVNIYFDLNDKEGAEKSLTEAIANDPNNKILHYIVGTVYSELKQNEKAEASLNKALEIDPDYSDAQYQLGAILIGWAADIRKEANDLKPGDKRYDPMMKQADDIFKRALTPLEKYVVKHPNEKDILTILSKLYRSLGNTEKYTEYKKRAEEAK
ncbi:MAG: tetratricopeptide repeat protein [Flavobacteriia bacterium]|nr:tetratricopeptide repeat protein [Flavobacteriia bacterium]